MWVGAVLFFWLGLAALCDMSDGARQIVWSRPVCAVVVRGAPHDVFWTARGSYERFKDFLVSYMTLANGWSRLLFLAPPACVEAK